MKQETGGDRLSRKQLLKVDEMEITVKKLMIYDKKVNNMNAYYYQKKKKKRNIASRIN